MPRSRAQAIAISQRDAQRTRLMIAASLLLPLAGLLLLLISP